MINKHIKPLGKPFKKFHSDKMYANKVNGKQMKMTEIIMFMGKKV